MPKYYINNAQRYVRALHDFQGFFDVVIELPEELAKKIFKAQDEMAEIEQWLRHLEGRTALRVPFDAATDERIPECLGVPKDEKPKKQATARRSSKKSQTKRVKIQSESATSQKTAG